VKSINISAKHSEHTRLQLLRLLSPALFVFLALRLDASPFSIAVVGIRLDSVASVAIAVFAHDRSPAVHILMVVAGWLILMKPLSQLLSQQSLWCGISHDLVKVRKEGIGGQGPRVQGRNAKYIPQRYAIFFRFRHGTRRLFLEPINRTNARHDAVHDIHEHAARKHECSHRQYRHDAHQLRQDDVENARFVRAKKVIVAQHAQRYHGAGPRVHQE
jgi:hypothetical protein